MRKHKFYFNMVEIALAIAIIAIGVSSIMVLFPIGINATRAAMDETNFPDAAEFTARFVRGKVLAFWKAQADANPSSPNFTKPTCFEKNAEPEAPADPAAIGTAITGFHTEVTGSAEGNGLRDLGSGNYLYTRCGDKGEEIFSAKVKIWNVTDGLLNKNTANTDYNSPLYMPNLTGEQKFAGDLQYNGSSLTAGGAVSFEGFAYSAMVKLEWNGNVKTFRVDVYNPYFILTPGSTP